MIQDNAYGYTYILGLDYRVASLITLYFVDPGINIPKIIIQVTQAKFNFDFNIVKKFYQTREPYKNFNDKVPRSKKGVFYTQNNGIRSINLALNHPYIPGSTASCKNE